MLRIVTFLLLTIVYSKVQGQVTFQFIPEIQGRNVDGLLNARIISAVQKKAVSLSVVVSERKSGKVLSIKTPAFSLNQGNNIIPPSAVRPAKIVFANSRLGNLIQQNGVLPEGEYEYCFTLTPEQGYDPEVPSEQCFDAEVTPFSPLNLTEPNDQDKICELRPLFSWQPSFPSIAGASYQLMLTEIKSGQNAVEAINYNLPLISQLGIINPVLPYPNAYRELQPGKKYAWQVSLYKNQTVLNRSEVWEFMVDCKDSVVRVNPEALSFRNIEDLSKGNYYRAVKAMHFSVINPYDAGKLSYSISGLSNPNKKVSNLPAINLENGINQISIDLSHSGCHDGHYYILKVTLPNGDIKSLRFLYNEF